MKQSEKARIAQYIANIKAIRRLEVINGTFQGYILDLKNPYNKK